MTDLPGDWSSRRRAAFLRDDFRCQHCDAVGGRLGAADLECHHVVPRRMDGAHDLENLLTLCADCHADLHGIDGGDCVRAGAGPTAVGATFESLPGPTGPWVARVVDGLAVALVVAVGASVLALSTPEPSPAETLGPAWALLTAVRGGDGVALAWLVSVLCVQFLFAGQPLVRRLPPERVPTPPAGTWQRWILAATGVAAVGLGGMLFEVAVVVGPSVSLTPQSWAFAYVLGGCTAVATAGAAVVGADPPGGASARWRRLCVVLGAGTVAGWTLLVAAEPAPGLGAPVVVGLVVARCWAPAE